MVEERSDNQITMSSSASTSVEPALTSAEKSSVSAGTRKRYLKGKSNDEEIRKAQVTQLDVLVGRGKGAYMSEGNVRFQKLVCGQLEAYKKAAANQEKAEITARIVKTVKHSGGRFLKEDDACIGRFIEIDDRQARVKVAQALRRWRRMDEKGEFICPESDSDSKILFPETRFTVEAPSQGLNCSSDAQHTHRLDGEIGVGNPFLIRQALALMQLHQQQQLQANHDLGSSGSNVISAYGGAPAYGLQQFVLPVASAAGSINTLSAGLLSKTRMPTAKPPRLLRQQILESTKQSLAEELPSVDSTDNPRDPSHVANPSGLDLLDAGRALCALSNMSANPTSMNSSSKEDSLWNSNRNGSIKKQITPSSSRPLKKRKMKYI